MAVCGGIEGAAGGSLTSWTARAKVAPVDCVPSPAVTCMVSVAGVSGSNGVPLNVRVVGLKVSHVGSELPLDSPAA